MGSHRRRQAGKILGFAPASQTNTHTHTHKHNPSSPNRPPPVLQKPTGQTSTSSTRGVDKVFLLYRHFVVRRSFALGGGEVSKCRLQRRQRFRRNLVEDFDDMRSLQFQMLCKPFCRGRDSSNCILRSLTMPLLLRQKSEASPQWSITLVRKWYVHNLYCKNNHCLNRSLQLCVTRSIQMSQLFIGFFLIYIYM